jgi:hypothetical protein
MKSLFELYAFAEELIELAIISGDEEVADFIEESVDSAMNQDVVEYQLAELLHAFIIIEDRIAIPIYPMDSVVTLRSTLRSMNFGIGSRYKN